MEGYVVADPEFRTVGDKQVLNFRMATNNGKRKVNGEEVEDTVFMNFSVWGESGVTLGKFAEKGTGLWVQCTLHQYPRKMRVEQKDGTIKDVNIPQYQMRVQQWGFLPNNKSAATAGNGNAASAAPAAQAAPTQAYQTGDPDDFAIIDDDQDLPF